MTDEDKALVPIRAYIDALNKGDVDGVRAAFHFPHISLARGKVTYSPTPESFSLQDFKNRVGPDGWVRSSFGGHRMVLAGPNKVHFDVWFTRWRGDGSAIGVHHSLYTVTEIDGRWGLQSRSSYG